MKKIFSIVLILAMLLTLPIAVSADTTATPTATDITPVKGAFKNGSQFYMYDYNSFDSATGDTLFSCDGEFFTVKPSAMNNSYNRSNSGAVLQYRKAMKGAYELSYQWKLNKTNKDSLMTFFYWQDYATSGNNAGRSYETSQRGTGFTLMTSVADGKVNFSVLSYDASSTYAKVTASTPAPTDDILTGASENAVLNIKMKWADNKLTVSATLASDETKTTGDAIFDASAKANVLEAVKDPAGFAFVLNAGADADACSAVGHISYKDLTAETPTATDITPVKGAFKNGSQFYMYDYNAFDASTGDTLFASDGEYFTVKPSAMNNSYNRSNSGAVLQYRKVLAGNYDLSYSWKLNKTNKDSMMTFFYWQDYATSGNNAGRSYETSQRGTGFTLMTSVADGKVNFSVLSYDASSTYAKVTASTPAPTDDILTGASENAVLNIKMKWADNKLTVSATLASDETKTTGDAIFDASAKANVLEAVKDPAGFAFVLNAGADADACSAVGHISYTDYSTDAPIIDPDYSFGVLNPSTYASQSEGNAFIHNADGTFARDTSAVATDNAVIAYKHATSYNYKLSFVMKLNADNRGRVGLWNIWDGIYSGSHYGYMFNLTALDGGKLEYRLARYDGKYSSGNSLITSATASNALDVKILEGQTANAELLITVTVQDKTLSVDVCLANDTSKKAGTVTYDFSAGSERTINRTVDRTLGFSIMDMAGQEGLVSSSYSKITYTALAGEAPTDEDVDTNDYNKILSDGSYAWNGSIAVTEDNFSFYNYNGLPEYELMSIKDGWMTRTNEGNKTDNESSEIRVNAYANAQYKGVMDGGDYKLTFKVKADANNHFRFSVLSRWDDKDGLSSVNFKNQTGYRIYFETTEENILHIFCYRTGGAGYLSPLPATAGNASTLSLAGIEAGKLEVEITIVMKDDLIVAEAHLASDASKTTGPVAFDMSDDVNLLGQIDRTQGFCLIDSANESKFAPASFGEFKIYSASEPKVAGGSGEIVDPDDQITTEEKKTAEVPTDESKKTSEDTKTEESNDSGDKGCKSGISFVPLAILLTVSAFAVVIGKKEKEK